MKNGIQGMRLWRIYTCSEAMEVKVRKEQEEAHEDGGSLEVSDGDINPRRKMTSDNGYLSFSVPFY